MLTYQVDDQFEFMSSCPQGEATMQSPNDKSPNRLGLIMLVGIGVIVALTWSIITLFEIAVAKALAIVILGLFGLIVLVAIGLVLLGVM